MWSNVNENGAFQIHRKTFKIAYLLYESLKIQILKKTVHTTHQIKCKINWGTGLSSENEAIAPVTWFIF